MEKKILVLAYMISPSKGSEFAVGWNYIKNMSKDNSLVVLYGISGDHMGNIDEILDFEKTHNLPNVRFIAIKPNRMANLLNWFNRHDIFVYTFYWAYTQWHKLAYKKAKELTQIEKFDLIHYLGPIGYREPGYLWKLNLPYMWGSIGGTGNVNAKLYPALTTMGMVKQGIRAVLNSIQLTFNPRVRKAIKRTNLLLTATLENQKNIEKAFGAESIYLPENGIEEIFPLNEDKFDDDRLHLIFVGNIDSRKSVITALKALTKVKQKDKIIFHIVGSGVLVKSLQEFCKTNNIDQMILWHGNVARQEVFELMNKAHLHITTSVMESNTTVIWEAMSKAVPTISLKHCGMQDTICDRCGFLIEIDNYNNIINNIAKTLDNCIENPQILRQKAEGVIQCRKKYLWSDRIATINSLYDKAIDDFNTLN